MNIFDGFWEEIGQQLDTIIETKPDTVDKIIKILGGPFFAGSGGDRQMYGTLFDAGWHIYWSEAEYHFKARHPVTGECLAYVEGDVYKIDE